MVLRRSTRTRTSTVPPKETAKGRGAKRKTEDESEQEEEEEDVHMVEGSSDEESSDDEEEEERTVVKLAPKARRAVSFAQKSSKKQSRRTGQASLATIAKKVLEDDETPENSLFCAVVRGDLERAARRLVALQADDSNQSSCALVNLLCRAVGGAPQTANPDQINLETLDDDAWMDMVSQVVDDMENASTLLWTADAPKQPGPRAFRVVYGQFFQTLATVALNAAGDDSRFQVEVVRDFLTQLMELVGFGQPDIRSAATCAVYRLADGMLEHTILLQSKLQQANRQLAAAKRAKQTTKAAALATRVESWKGTLEDLEEMVQDIVASVLLKRYRDSHAQIRAASIASLTQFVMVRPDIFGQPTYLKYIAWMLSDKDETVRLAAVNGFLLPLTSIDTELIKPVFDKFTPRLADCVLDVSKNVQEVAMQCLLELNRRDLLDTEDERIWQQINGRALADDTTPVVRRDALYFVLEQLETFDNAQQSETMKAERIKELVEWISHVLADGDIPLEHIQFDLVRYIVESLRAMPEHKSLVCSWSALLKALGSEPKVSRRMESTQQRVVLQLLVQAAKLETIQRRTGVDPDLVAAEAARAVVQPAKKQRKTDSSHEALTIALVRTLPDLLDRFKNDAGVQRSLTELPQYFLASVFNLPSRKKDFNALVSKLSSTFLEASDREILYNCVFTLSSLSRGNHARSDDARLKLCSTAVELRDRLLEVLQAKKEFLDGKSKDKQKELDIEHAVLLSLRRLAVLSKQYDLAKLLADEDDDSESSHVESLCSEITDVISQDLKQREAAQTDSSIETKIWKKKDSSVHSMFADSISETFAFLLSASAWRLNDEIKEHVTDDVVPPSSEVVKRMRDSVVNLLVLCYEQFVDVNDDINFLDERLAFADAVQTQAGQVAGDLRSLFPRVWKDAESPLLRSLALSQDGHLIGGFVRFIRSKDEQLSQEEAEKSLANDLLFPLARALAPNWQEGVRREAGVVLTHIAGSGQEARDLVVRLSRVLKKVDPVRLLEAHMSCLCEDFDAWTNSEPDELENEQPTEEEMANFEDAEKQHKEQFELLEKRAQRLAATLGVGKITDKAIAGSILGFAREGLRFAFSTSVRDEEDLPLGARLPFLRVLSKYMTWIRRDRSHLAVFCDEFNEAERRLREHEEYPDVFDDDKATIVEFRKMFDLGPFADDGGDSIQSADDGSLSVGSHSQSQTRLSMMSGISSIRSKESTKASLSPLYEEEASDNSDANEDD